MWKEKLQHECNAGRPTKGRAAVLAIESLENRCLLSGSDVVLHWNEILMQSLSSNLHAPRVPLARNMALVHVAMFDAVNAIDRSYEGYAANVKASSGASQEAAAAQAAHDTLVALYPSRQAVFDAALAEDLAGIPRGRARQGIAIGQEVARQILDLRSTDGAADVETYTPKDGAGQWHPTFPDFSQAAAAHVPSMTPFAIESATQFQPGPHPALSSPEYAAAFNQTKVVGAFDAETADRDNNGLPDRTAQQSQTALLWRVPLTHHQVWNRVAQDVVRAQDTSLVESARAFALLNMAFNDALQTSFASKFHFGLWRPVEAIRSELDDGNAQTQREAGWRPLHPGTPPYPSYAGNAATIGAASATVLSEVFGDNVPFEIRWDSYGFPGVTRSYDRFWAAADEEAISRVYGGIHYTFDSVAGQGIGANVGNYVVDNFLEPQKKAKSEAAADRSAPPAQAARPGLRLLSRDEGQQAVWDA